MDNSAPSPGSSPPRPASSAATPATPPTPPSAPRRSARKHRHQLPADALLSFSRYTPASSPDAASRQKRPSSKHTPRPRDHFVQSNFRFVVDHAALPPTHPAAACANVPLDWTAVDLVSLPTLPSCPICLHHPRVARLTLCGHVFCAVCIAQHVAHAHAAGRPSRCPLCADRLVPELLKPALPSRPCAVVDAQPHAQAHQPGSVGARARDEHADAQHVVPPLRLIARTRGSTLAHAARSGDADNGRAIAVHRDRDAETQHPPLLDSTEPFYARFAYGSTRFLLAQVDRERAELAEVLADEPQLAPFVAVLRAELDTRRAAVQGRTSPPSTRVDSGACAAASSPSSSSHPDSHIGGVGGDDEPAAIASSQPRASPPRKKKASRWLYYQACDGDNVFLHPVCHRLLCTEFGSDLLGAPAVLRDMPLLQHDRLTMDETLRKRFRFLDHLGDGCEFSFVELDVAGLVSPRTLAQHETELRDRRGARKKRLAASARESKLVRKRETEVLQEYASSLRGVARRAGENALYSRDVHSFPALSEPPTNASASDMPDMSTDAGDPAASASSTAATATATESGTESATTTDVDSVTVPQFATVAGSSPPSLAVSASSSPARWGAAVSSYSSVTSNMGLFPALGDSTRPNAPTAPAPGLANAALRGAWRPAQTGSMIGGDDNGSTTVPAVDTPAAATTPGANDATERATEPSPQHVPTSQEDGGRKGRKWRGKSTTIVLSNAGAPYHRQ